MLNEIKVNYFQPKKSFNKVSTLIKLHKQLSKNFVELKVNVNVSLKH